MSLSHDFLSLYHLLLTVNCQSINMSIKYIYSCCIIQLARTVKRQDDMLETAVSSGEVGALLLLLSLAAIVVPVDLYYMYHYFCY